MLKGIQMIFRALAVMALCLVMIQAAFAGNDKNRVFIAKRWYSESYLKNQLETVSPQLLRNAFHESVAYTFAADGPPSNLGGYTYYSQPMSTRQGDNFRWRAEDGGKNLDAEIDRLCVLEIASGLAALKFQITKAARQMNFRRGDLKKGVVAGIRSGQLTSAPLDLNSNGGRPISVIPPEGTERLLCNVYATKKSKEVIYQVSVALTAEGFYSKGL